MGHMKWVGPILWLEEVLIIGTECQQIVQYKHQIVNCKEFIQLLCLPQVISIIRRMNLMKEEREAQVRVWEEECELPTYGVGEPEKNPMFLDKRVYQGSSGRSLPLPGNR